MNQSDSASSSHEGATAPGMTFEPRCSEDPTVPGGNVPSKVFQTFSIDNRQDSSTPLGLSFTVTSAIGRALACAYTTSVKEAEADLPGGRYGRFFRVVFCHSSFRPIVCGSEDGSDREEHVIVPQVTYSFDPDPHFPNRILMEVKRKFLPPSKNHGDLHFRLIITVRIPDFGKVEPLISDPFKVFSKQSEERARPPPKRQRNAPPTKPVIALMDSDDLDTLGVLSGDTVAAAPRRLVAVPRAKRLCVAVLKDDDAMSASSGTISDRDASSDDDDEPVAKRVCKSPDVFANPAIVRPVEIAHLHTWAAPSFDTAGVSILSSRRARLLSVSSSASDLLLAPPPVASSCKGESFGSLLDGTETASAAFRFPDLSSFA